MSNQFSHEKIIQLRKKRSAADRRFKTYGLIAVSYTHLRAHETR